MIEQLKARINEIFVGKENVTENVLICLLSGGHVLLEDVPGVGKTTLVKTIAALLDLSFARIQFTPDTLPSDVVGVNVFNQKTGEFEFKKGAIMHSLILADEINRTSPKTQAALLEAMSEGTVSVDSKTYPLSSPFMVIATQNPKEFIGTYPLPEAQTDRFMMRLSIGYPDKDSELRLIKNHLEGNTPDKTENILNADDILKLQNEVKNVHVSDGVSSYIRDIIRLTREDERFFTGGSVRAMLHLVDASRAHARFYERDFVKPDDVKAVAVNVLHHRLTLTADAKIHAEDTDNIIQSLILKAKIPME
ncbi:MAG: MoxR family ATPase [Lachnospiraceae bacterium]|nr:MoxR family ATPase [Lachnospiraceae bacterium]